MEIEIMVEMEIEMEIMIEMEMEGDSVSTDKYPIVRQMDCRVQRGVVKIERLTPTNTNFYCFYIGHNRSSGRVGGDSEEGDRSSQRNAF
jgi:hypothetical protein